MYYFFLGVGESNKNNFAYALFKCSFLLSPAVGPSISSLHLFPSLTAHYLPYLLNVLNHQRFVTPGHESCCLYHLPSLSWEYEKTADSYSKECPAKATGLSTVNANVSLSVGAQLLCLAPPSLPSSTVWRKVWGGYKTPWYIVFLLYINHHRKPPESKSRVEIR